MKLTLERQIPLAFIVAMLLLVTIGFFAYRSTNSLNQAIFWEKHTQIVLTELDETMILTLGAETGGRGYLITGDEEFLTPYNQAKQEITNNFRRLHELLTDNPQQTEKLNRLEQLVNEKFDFTRYIIETRQNKGLDSAVDLTKSGRGRVLMDEIRVLTAEIKDEEKRLLIIREGDLDNSVRATYRTLLLGSLAGIFSLGLANLAILRETQKRRRAEEDLRTTNLALENRVEKRTRELTVVNEDLTTEITKRHQSEVVLRDSEERYRKLFNSIDQGFCVFEMLFDDEDKPVDYRFLEINPMFEELTGISQSEALSGKTIREILPNLENKWIETYGKIALTGEAVRFVEGSDAMNRWFDVYGFRVGGEDSRKVALLFNNITEQRKAEQEREKLLHNEQIARRDAEIANRLRDEFLATVSHELRAPLNSILGWARLMQQGKLDEKNSERAKEIIIRNAESQNRLIEDLLDVSRIISGKLRLEVMTVDPNNIIESALETIRPAAEAKNITLEVIEDPEISHISGDPDRLQQVVWNLLSNAVKFTPNDGKVSVAVKRSNAHIEIRVADTGAGIDKDFLPHVFDRFRQADASSIRKFGGLGLGLAIVRHLTEMHGGTVHAESEGKGKGSTFIVRFPAIRTSETSDGDASAISSQTRSNLLEKETKLSLDGLLILAVDDEEDARQLLVHSLTYHGATVITAASAKEALAEIKNKTPDVLVSDIGMPDEDGYSLIRKIRAANNNIPAIALTAFTRAQDRVRALEAGFQTHISKPVEPDELVAVIVSQTGRLQINDVELS